MNIPSLSFNSHSSQIPQTQKNDYKQVWNGLQTKGSQNYALLLISDLQMQGYSIGISVQGVSISIMSTRSLTTPDMGYFSSHQEIVKKIRWIRCNSWLFMDLIRYCNNRSLQEFTSELMTQMEIRRAQTLIFMKKTQLSRSLRSQQILTKETCSMGQIIL